MLLCSLLGLVAGMAAAMLLKLVPFAGFAVLGDAGWLDLPRPEFLHYGISLELLPAFPASARCAAASAAARWRSP
jgi:xanthine permease XanP